MGIDEIGNRGIDEWEISGYVFRNSSGNVEHFFNEFRQFLRRLSSVMDRVMLCQLSGIFLVRQEMQANKTKDATHVGLA